MLNEYVFVPFVLDKTSKVDVRLSGNLELKGEGWRCGLKTFSMDKKWSLMNEEISIIYTNGYKSVLKPKEAHSVTELDKILEEMLGKTRVKRGDLFDEMMNTDDDEEKEEEKPREITPPPSLMPFEPKKLDARKSKEENKPVQPPPSLLPLEPDFLGPKKIDVAVELKGEGWRCGLKTFSMDKKWSLMNEEISIIYTNGYKSVLKPKEAHSVTELDKILEEMLGKTRVKRGDLFDEMMNTDDDEEKEEEKPREITPPPSLMPFEPKKLDARKSKEENKPVQLPPSLLPLEPDFLGPKKIDVAVNDTDNVKILTLPTDEDGKMGEKEYLVYKILKDAFYYSPELPPTANVFTKKGYESVEFTFNSMKNRYEVTYDPVYVRGIHLSQGFCDAMGFKQVIFNHNIAPNPPKIENLHSPLHIYSNNVVCPIFCGTDQESILDILPVTPDVNPISKTYERPNYLRITKNNIDTIEIEFKDIYGNPIYGANANGHIVFEFKKFSK